MATAPSLSLSSALYLNCPRLNHLNLSTSVGRGSSFRCKAGKKIGFFDQILDYIEGGPKLRRWYGAPDLLPKDGPSVEDGDEVDSDQLRDAVLVTDGDTDIGQMVILSLIIKRARVKALVKDKRAAVEAFGNYVEAMAGDTNNKMFMKKALRGVRAIICPSEGVLSKIERLRGVQHIVLLSLLSTYEGSGGIAAIMNSNLRKLAEQDESIVVASGVPYTIIRSGFLLNTPGGTKGFNFEEGSAASGQLSKEDAAFICVEALGSIPQAGLKFEVANGEEMVSDWKNKFKELAAKTEQLS